MKDSEEEVEEGKRREMRSGCAYTLIWTRLVGATWKSKGIKHVIVKQTGGMYNIAILALEESQQRYKTKYLV